MVDSALSDRPRKGDFSSLSDSAVLLTKAEAKQLSEELEDVLRRWSERGTEDDEELTTYLYWGAILPYPAVEPG